MQITIRHELPTDFAAIRQVNVEAFQGEDEARLVDDLRRLGYQRLGLVAEVEDQIVGHILFSELRVIEKSQDRSALALAPMAVLPNYQRQGVGTALVRRGLALCREQGHRAVIVLGHPEYYPRFGFSSELAKPLHSPYSGPAWMALELVEGALQNIRGSVCYPPPFGMFEHD